MRSEKTNIRTDIQPVQNLFASSLQAQDLILLFLAQAADGLVINQAAIQVTQAAMRPPCDSFQERTTRP
jgi:hypothetical protein